MRFVRRSREERCAPLAAAVMGGMPTGALVFEAGFVTGDYCCSGCVWEGAL